VVLAYVGAATTKSILVGAVILITANAFVPVPVEHPAWMVAFLVLTATTFCLFGFILGIWANGFEQLNFIPMLVITPLTFPRRRVLLDRRCCPEGWRTFSLFNPDRVPHQRIPLDLLRRLRRAGRG
jgi:ABC-2 type transport system permease protein